MEVSGADDQQSRAGEGGDALGVRLVTVGRETAPRAGCVRHGRSAELVAEDAVVVGAAPLAGAGAGEPAVREPRRGVELSGEALEARGQDLAGVAASDFAAERAVGVEEVGEEPGGARERLVELGRAASRPRARRGTRCVRDW